MSDYIQNLLPTIRTLLLPNIPSNSNSDNINSNYNYNIHSVNNIFPILQSYVKLFRDVLNTKGFVLLFFLYLLRFRSIYSLTKNVLLAGGLIFGLCANFNLDLDLSARKKRTYCWNIQISLIYGMLHYLQTV